MLKIINESFIFCLEAGMSRSIKKRRIPTRYPGLPLGNKENVTYVSTTSISLIQCKYVNFHTSPYQLYKIASYHNLQKIVVLK